MGASDTLNGSRVELELPAEPASVSSARLAVVELAERHGFGADALPAVAVAVSEAASNVVVHAYEGRAPGSLFVCAEMDGDELCVTVSDEGPGLRPRINPPGLGLGLPLIAVLAAHMEVGSDADGRNFVRMRFGRDTGPTSLRTTPGRFPPRAAS